jgi:hypothetical protein
LTLVGDIVGDIGYRVSREETIACLSAIQTCRKPIVIEDVKNRRITKEDDIS